ncbi:MAG: hypothetical protein MUC87_17455 [Bacteroidia bacterium]|nr:hypothetical protein [Bacteroidia bacterium]
MNNTQHKAASSPVRKPVTALIALLLFFVGFSKCYAQTVPDKDLVTLRNGNQILGYVIEQRPGESISVYRPEMNDTVKVALEDVQKISKIMITILPNDSAKKIAPIAGKGRYNNKKNVFQFGYQYMALTSSIDEDVEYLIFDHILHGVCVSYFRNINNRYFPGISVSFANKKAYTYADRWQNYNELSYKKMLILIENKFRLSKKPQNFPMCFTAAFNIGFLRDKSFLEDNRIYGYSRGSFYRYQNSFVAQTLFGFKINPDKKSGFILEIGVSWNRQRINVYNIYNSLSKKINSWEYIPTVRLQYFF